MIASIPSAVLVGIDGKKVAVEVHVSNGLPGFTVVGLPDAAVRESRDRVRAALLSSGLPWPLRRVTVNLAPSGMRKGGAGLDLPIAVGVLVASGTVDPHLVEGVAFFGELGLDGSIRGVPGTLALVDALRRHRMVVPSESAAEARLAGDLDLLTSTTLAGLVAGLSHQEQWRLASRARDRRRAGATRSPGGCRVAAAPTGAPDLADIRGQRIARRALEVAAAGGHHLLMVGPPGSGKSMLAARLQGLLPDLSPAMALEVTRIHSAAGLSLPVSSLVGQPPFRAPHHTVSPVAMIGGGSTSMRPGEISLAHGGVLFLDEMGEFPPQVLDALRQPLEEGQVRVSRAHGTATFPARFMLVGAMNPCACGEGRVSGRCRCGPLSLERYARRLSAPLLDRFDIAVSVERPEPEELTDPRPGERTAVVAERVARARQRSAERGVAANTDLPTATLGTLAPMSAEATAVVEGNLRSGVLSARGLHRVQRVARTLADLDEVGPVIEEAQVREALQLRSQRALFERPGGP